MAGEEEVVLRGDGEGVAHEGSGIDEQAAGHGTGDTAEKVSAGQNRANRTWDGSVRTIWRQWRLSVSLNVHIRVLLGIHYSGERNTEVGDRAPEVCEGKDC